MSSKRTQVGAMVAMILATAPAADARAQQAEAEIVGLEEIVVTARKREESLMDVPGAVSALSAAALELRQVTDLGDLSAVVPNMTVYAARGSNTTLTAYIRGVGQADPLWGVDPGVGLYLDDVYIARPQGALLDVYDVARVEVLRGPQGSLYGKNTIGGAIKYVSAELENELSGKVSADVGNYSAVDLKAMINAPLGDTLTLRAAFASLQRDGFGRNVVTGQDVSDKDTTAGRVALRWQPSDSFDITLSGDFTQDDSKVRGARRLNAFNPFDPARTPPNDNNYDVNNDFANINPTDAEGYSLTIGWDGGGPVAIKSITAYRESETLTYIDFDTLNRPIANVSATYEDDQLSQELQFIYAGDNGLSGIAGLYYFDGSAGGQVRNNFFNLIFGDTQGTVETTSWAVFGEVTWAASDRVNVTVGGRYTSEKKAADVFNQGYTNATFTVPTGVIAADFDKSKTFSSFSPKLALDYQWTDSTMAYLSISRGFKSGGYNIRANATAVPRSAEPFDEETVTAYEIGSKSTLLDGRMTLNAAYFLSDYEDVQLSVFTSYDSNGDGTNDAFFGDFTNAGKARIHGAELEVAMTPAEGWNVQASVAYLNAKYTEFLTGGVDVSRQQKLTNAPKWQLGLNASYTHALAGGTLTWQTGGRYQSLVIPTTDLSPVIAQNGYGLVNASIMWASGDGHWKGGVWGRNLGDKEYRTTGYNIPTLGVLTGFYGAPRTYGATVSYSF